MSSKAHHSLEKVKKLWAGDALLNESQKKEAGMALITSLPVLPDESSLLQSIHEAFLKKGGEVRATPEQPVSDALEKAGAPQVWKTYFQ